MKAKLFLAAAITASSAVLADEIDNAGHALGTGSVTAPAAFTDFTDFATWQSAFGAPVTRIDFTTLAGGTVVTSQFSAQGVTFDDGDDTIVESGTFVEDGVGLQGFGRIRVALSHPARAIGAFFPGALVIEAFESEGGASIHTSADFAGSGTGHFGGIVGDADFSFVEIRDWVDDTAFIDDLVIGFAPAAGAVTGCIEVTGIPLTLNVVLLLQRDEPAQWTLTDANGCYAFEDAVPGKWFSIVIVGTLFP